MAEAIVQTSNAGFGFVEELVAETQRLAESVASKTEIPLDGFSDDVQQIIRYFADFTGSCTNFVTMDILTTLGAVAGVRLHSQFKSRSNYGQLYTILYAKPSSNKSQSIGPVISPFRERNSFYIRNYNHDMELWESDPKNHKRPNNKQFIITRSTPEAAIDVLYENQNGILWHNDEIKTFFANLNAYNKGDFTGDLNSAYVNGEISVNIKTAKRVVDIPNPVISILGTFQPCNAKQYFSKNIDGLLQRFCFVLPNASKIHLCDYDDSLTKKWARIAFSILEMPVMNLQFEKDAQDLLEEWGVKMKEEQKEIEQTDEILAGMLSKTSFFVYRIATIVHLISNGTDITNQYTLYPEITRYEVDFAIRITNVLFEGAKAVLADIRGTSDSFENITLERLVWLVEKKFGTINQSAFARAVGRDEKWVCRSINKFRKKEDQ